MRSKWLQTHCEECKAELIRTSELYYCCPNGHGKLFAAIGECRFGTAKREAHRSANLFAKALPRYLRAAKKLANWKPTYFGGSNEAHPVGDCASGG